MNKLIIQTGEMYQEWINLIGLVEEDTANILNGIAAKDGWCEFQPKEALNMGFEELVNLSGNRCSCTGR